MLHEVEPEQHKTVTISRCGERVAVVDAEDYPLISKYRWCVHSCGKGKHYARAERHPDTGDKLRLYMHRLIAEARLGPAPGPDMVVDHLDGNGLNNSASNLRWADRWANRWRW